MLNDHNIDLRNISISIFQKESQSVLSSDNLRGFMQSFVQLGVRKDILTLLKNSNSLYTSLLLIGYVNTHHALPILESFLEYGNIFSIAAFQALRTRADRFPNEKESIKILAKTIWDESTADTKLRYIALRFLTQSGGTLNKYFIFWKSLLLKVGRALLLGWLLYINIYLLIPLLEQYLPISTSVIFSHYYIWILKLIISGTILIDAKIIGAKRIPGCLDPSCWNPWLYGFGCFFMFPIIFPIYILYRDRIWRNKVKIDWVSLEQKYHFGSSISWQ